MIYVVLGALLVGASLGLLGSGGAILTVPVLRYVLHHPEKAAIAEALAIVAGIAAFSAAPYARAGLIDWRVALLFGLPGVLGTYGGAFLAKFVAGRLQLLVLAAAMLTAAALMWRPRREPEAVTHPPQRSLGAVLGLMLQGAAVGALTGFVGVGGGFLIVPALAGLGGLPLRRAVGTSLAIITAQSLTGWLKYLWVLDKLAVPFDWATVGVFIAIGMCGSYAGTRLGQGIDPRSLRRGFSMLLALLGVAVGIAESVAFVRGVA